MVANLNMGLSQEKKILLTGKEQLLKIQGCAASTPSGEGGESRLILLLKVNVNKPEHK